MKRAAHQDSVDVNADMREAGTAQRELGVVIVRGRDAGQGLDGSERVICDDGRKILELCIVEGFRRGDARLNRLERVGLIDDLEYARAFLREKLGRRAVGARLLRSQLLARGVGGAVADEAMAQLTASDDGSRTELDRARRAATQFARRYARLDPKTRRQRLSAALVRRGFDYDTVSEALRALEGEGGN